VIIGIVLILRGALFLVVGWQLHKLNGALHGGMATPAGA
jgi:hypothetical protein